MSVSLAVAAQHAPIAGLSPALRSEPSAPELQLAGTVLRLAADRALYVEGDEARCFYKVVSGVVRTCRHLSDGRRQIDGFYHPGEVFGIEAGTAHGLTAEAVTDCTVIAYRRRSLEAMMLEDGRLSQWFFNHSMTCMTRVREHSLLWRHASATQKVAAFLLEMAERGESDPAIELPMGRQDIADYLGLTIEIVCRTLSRMEKEGIITLPSARRVVLQDRATLRELNS
jgi:CRP/FNR family transcriptional regulator, nitrogen fixation regulation protein